jgi:hypothetical protein
LSQGLGQESPPQFECKRRPVPARTLAIGVTRPNPDSQTQGQLRRIGPREIISAPPPPYSKASDTGIFLARFLTTMNNVVNQVGGRNLVLWRKPNDTGRRGRCARTLRWDAEEGGISGWVWNRISMYSGRHPYKWSCPAHVGHSQGSASF